MNIVFVGPGQGKSITAALLAVTHVVTAYDADPYRALVELYPRAEVYEGPDDLIPPCIIDTSRVDRRGRPYLAVIRENPGAWVILVTTPFFHQVAVARRVAKDVKDCTGTAVRGVIVSMAASEDEAKSVAERLGVPLTGWLPLSKALEEMLATGTVISEKEDGASPVGDAALIERILALGKELGLQVRLRQRDKKRGRLPWLKR